MRPTFFTDRDLGRSVPAALRVAGILVEEHMDHFEHDTADETWIAVVAAKGWVAITHNERIRYTPNEKAAVMRARLGLIVLVGKVRHAQHAENFVRGIAKIEAFVAAQERPFIAKLYRATPAELARNTDATGRIERWV